MNKLLTALLFSLVVVSTSFAGDVLFFKVSRNYDSDGVLGRVKRREFENRLFKHSEWRQRLFCSYFEPDVDESLETYSRSDGSQWLSHRKATPSLSRIISNRIWLNMQFDLNKELNAVRISSHEVRLPESVAKELDLLWQTMLPGLPEAPIPRQFHVDVPKFIAFSRDNGRIKSGSIAIAAYDTTVYNAFIGIFTDLTKACDRNDRSVDALFERLPEKIRALRKRL